LFCLFGVTIPLNELLVQTAMSRADPAVLLRSELWKKAVIVLSMGVGAWLGPAGFLIALCLGSYIAMFVSIRVVAELLGISVWEVTAPALPGAVVALLMGVPAYAVLRLPWGHAAGSLAAAAVVGAASYAVLSVLFRLEAYQLARQLLLQTLFPNRYPAADFRWAGVSPEGGGGAREDMRP
jgi:hypothetical protein